MNCPETHHVLFTRRTWEADPAASRLRQHHSLLVELDHDTHLALHQRIVTVPLLDHVTVRRVGRLYAPLSDNPIKNVEHLQRCISQSSTATEISKRLGGLAVYTLDVSKDFLRAGWYAGF